MLLPEGHRLARPVVVTIHDPVDEPFFLLDMPHRTVALELRSVEMIRSLVANGHGVSILVTRPVGDLSYDGRSIVCCPFDSTVPAQRVVVAARQTTQLPRPATAFLEVMRDRFMKS